VIGNYLGQIGKLEFFWQPPMWTLIPPPICDFRSG